MQDASTTWPDTAPMPHSEVPDAGIPESQGEDVASRFGDAATRARLRPGKHFAVPLEVGARRPREFVGNPSWHLRHAPGIRKCAAREFAQILRKHPIASPGLRPHR